MLDASTGFFLVKREVFEKMMQAYPELHYRNDSNIDEKFNKYCYALFDTWLDPDDNRYLIRRLYFLPSMAKTWWRNLVRSEH